MLSCSNEGAAARVLGANAGTKLVRENGAVEEWQLSSTISRIQASRSYFIIMQ